MIKLYTFGQKNLIFDSILKDITKCVDNNNNDLLKSFQIDKIINDIVCTNDTILILFSNGDILCKRLTTANTTTTSIIPNIICNEIKFNFKVYKISSGFNHLHIITNDNSVFGMGDNSFNQIGLPMDNNNNNNNNNNKNNWYESFQLIEYFILDTTNNITITSISSGYHHTIFHDCNNNTIYTCGSNKYGQLGKPLNHDNTTINIHGIELLQSSVSENIGKIIKICSGDNHNLIINSDGKVYGFGNNSYGQLGIQNDENLIYIDVPTMLESLNEDNSDDVIIVDGKCSNWHSLLLSNDGRVFSFGNGSYQLGIGDDNSINIPIELDELSPPDFIIKEISCSMHSSLFLDSENRLFYCGENLSYDIDDNNNNNNNSNYYNNMVKYPTSISQIINNHNINFKPNKLYSHCSNFSFIW